MKRHEVGMMLGVGALAIALGMRPAAERGPVVVDLSRPGDAIVIMLEGKSVGGLRVDAQGRLGIYGPNKTSTAITVDGHDHVQIDPAPVDAPPARLSVANDAWLTGVLRVGRSDAFGEAPFDPNGAIQVGRNLSTAQPMSLMRFFAQGREAFRLGATADGHGFWSDGSHDVPLVTFRSSSERLPHTGSVEFYDATFSYRDGSVHGRNPHTGRATEVVPK